MNDRARKRPYASVIRLASLGAIAAAVGFVLVQEAPRWAEGPDQTRLSSEATSERAGVSPFLRLARAAGPDAPHRDLTEIAEAATRSIVLVPER